jgi:hypothetical protein
MIKLEDIRRNSIVMLRGSFGSDPARRATINDVFEDIKNGRPGVDYTGEKGGDNWAYLTQIVSVIKY